MKAPQRRYELSADEWRRIASYFPVRKTGIKGRPYNDVRTTVNGIIWIARSGAPWRDLPERYGKWNTVYKCFAKWQEQGVFEKVFHELRIEADLQDISIDSTSCKAHQHSAGAKKGGLTAT
jgi:transposase